MKNSSEVLSIIEAGMEGDTEKLQAYTKLLVSKLPETELYLKEAINSRLTGEYKNQLKIKTKKCSKCKETKPLYEFYLTKKKKPQSYCKECMKIYMRNFHNKRNKKNRDGRPLLAGTGVRWTKEEIKKLKSYYPIMKTPLIVKWRLLPGRTDVAINRKAEEFGLVKRS